MKDLDDIRQVINACDKEIMEKLSLRFKYVQKVSEIKKEKGLSIFDPTREEEIIRSIQEKEESFSQEIAEVYKSIMSTSRQYQSKQLLPNRIFLIGFMGAGKTTIGKLLSEVTGFNFIDTDQIIEEKTKMKIYDIFHKKGEKHFRTLETEVLTSLEEENLSIISCGGGIILKEENRKFLKEKGKTIFLNGSIETLMDRVENNDDRPLLTPILKVDPKKQYEAFNDILKSRMAYYEESADIVINIDGKKPAEIVGEVLRALIR